MRRSFSAFAWGLAVALCAAPAAAEIRLVPRPGGPPALPAAPASPASAGDESGATRGLFLPPRARPLPGSLPLGDERAQRPAGGAAISILVEDATAALAGADTLPQGLYFGASWVDLDGDGDLDLTIPFDAGPLGHLRIWRNDGGAFTDVTESLGLAGIAQARTAGWLDLDGDGDLDLFVTRRSSAGTNLVFEQVDGQFVPAPPGSGLDGPSTEVGQAWADFDRDGDLDLYLPAAILAPQRLLLREGPFQFRDASAESGLDPEVVAIAGAWGDFDDDGDPDLAVGLGGGLRLYRNDGGHFADVTGDGAAVGGFLVVPSWVDADADGDLDLFAGGFYPPRLLENVTASGEVSFVDRTLDWGTGYGGSSGGAWEDLDLDGDLDLLDDGGSLGMRVHENSIPGGGRLTDVSAAAGLPESPGVGWQPVVGDFDGDGRADFFSPHENAAALYRNASLVEGSWVRLRLVPRVGGVAAGARARLAGGASGLVREVAWPATGFGFGSADLVFAIGAEPVAPPVEVRWASGLVERFYGLAAGALHHLVEGSGGRIRLGPPPPPSAPPAPLAAPSPGLASSCNPCREPVRLAFECPDCTAPPVAGVYDSRGRLARVLAADASGVTWDLRDRSGRRVAPGVYWVRVELPSREVRASLVVIR